MTPNEFAELIASVTAWIGDRALDENLDAGLNANFPANGALFRLMVGLSTADQRVSPPRIDIPRDYNAAHDLIERNLQAGRASKVAYIDDRGSTTYAELAERVNRCSNALIGLGLEPEQRVLLCVLDTIDFPTAF